ncbi:hypothetical protein ACFQ08_35015, partial [Streptosporangium algeriense]
MRINLRRTLAVGAAVAVIGALAPAAAAFSQDDDRSCNDLMGDDAPAFIVCRWLAKPDEAYDIVKFWGANDNANLKAATPADGQFIDCSAPGSSCPRIEGDSVVGDENTPLPEGVEDGGSPECETGQECAVGGYEEGGDGTESAPEQSNGLKPTGQANTGQNATTQAAQQV